MIEKILIFIGVIMFLQLIWKLISRQEYLGTQQELIQVDIDAIKKRLQDLEDLQ